jgi:molybdopterin molybdotransferase
MLSFDEALELVLREVTSLGIEHVALADAAHRVLASDLRSPAPLPPFDSSERDGYALDPATIQGAPPYRVPVTGSQRAGQSSGALAPGTTARIFTGAALPVGATAIVMQEDVSREGDVAVLDRLPAAGAYVRHRGSDLNAGAVALTCGTRLSAGALSLAAMLGIRDVPVARRPRVMILPSGDELRPPGVPLREGEIFESNAVALATLARQAGADAEVLPIVPDQEEAVRHAIEEALAGCDLLVTAGGVSVGDFDLIRPALSKAGVALDFWRVAIKPGKPLAFSLFGLPLLRALQGDARPRPLPLSTRLVKPPSLSADREQFLRVTIESKGDGLYASALPQQAAGAAVSLAASDGLVRIPRGQGVLDSAVFVPFFRWSDL